MYHRSLGRDIDKSSWGQDWPPGFPPVGKQPTAKDIAAQIEAGILPGPKKTAAAPAAARPGAPGPGIMAKLYPPGEFPFALVALVGGTLVLVWLLNRPRSE